MKEWERERERLREMERLKERMREREREGMGNVRVRCSRFFLPGLECVGSARATEGIFVVL